MSEPATLVMHAGTASLIRVLAGADETFTVRQLGRLAGVSPNRAHQVVERLTEHGLVLTEQKGTSRLCQLNRDHLAASAVVEIARLRGAMLDLLRDEIGGWKPSAVHASLFGSAARGDGSTTSDLDILVVRPAQVSEDDQGWADQLAEAGRGIYRATGNRVAWFSLSRTELVESVVRKEAIVDEWLRDSVHLTGTRLRAIVESA